MTANKSKGSDKISRRDFVQKSAATSLAVFVAPSIIKADNSDAEIKQDLSPKNLEWRNKQNGMVYRKLGRTGLMVSELVMGTFPFNDIKHLSVVEAAVERGINYLDTASAYSQGKVETVIGNYIKTPAHREKVFLSTKLSTYYSAIDGFIDEMIKDLSETKKSQIRKNANILLEERGALKAGYHVNYFGGQERQFDQSYFRYFVLKEYGYQKEWKKKIKAHVQHLFESSLKRLQTDYIDVLFLPHALTMPEMLDDDILKEVFAEWKQQGVIKASAVSFHNDVSANLSKAIEMGFYDVAMFAYNITNHAALENLIYQGKKADMGLIAMKIARNLAMKDQPSWRLDKLNATIPDKSLSKFAKAYLWGLQNQNLSACISQMETVEIIEENLSVIGRKVELQKV